jgi:hypothetical protein
MITTFFLNIAFFDIDDFVSNFSILGKQLTVQFELLVCVKNVIRIIYIEKSHDPKKVKTIFFGFNVLKSTEQEDETIFFSVGSLIHRGGH